MSTQRDLDYSFVLLDIENNPNNYVFNVKVHNETVISQLIQIFYKKLKEAGIQLPQDYANYGIYYDPNSVDNIITQQKENKQGMELRRGSTRLKSSVMKPKDNLSPIASSLSSSLSITEATPSAWRELAKMTNETNKNFYFVVDELSQPTLTHSLHDDDSSNNNNNRQNNNNNNNNNNINNINNNNNIIISEEKTAEQKEEFEAGKKYSARSRNRSSSLDLGGLSEVMNAGNQGYWHRSRVRGDSQGGRCEGGVL